MKKMNLPKTVTHSIVKCALLLAASVSLNVASAQHNTGTPVYGYYDNSVFEYKAPFNNTDTLFERVQIIYVPALLKTLSSGTTAPSGTISKVYLRTKPGTSKVFNMTNVLIKLGQTTDTAYDAGTSPDVPFITTTTEVFKQAAYTVSSPGWIEFTLSKPFAYDNKKSLVLEISGDNGFNCTYTSSGAKKVIMGQHKSTTGAYVPMYFEFGFDFNFPSAISNVTGSEVNIQVYPNPATDKVQISCSEKMEGRILITDINGRTISEEQFSGAQHMLHVASLTNGLYFYKIFNAENILLSTGKLTVAH